MKGEAGVVLCFALCFCIFSPVADKTRFVALASCWGWGGEPLHFGHPVAFCQDARVSVLVCGSFLCFSGKHIRLFDWTSTPLLLNQ